MKSSILAVLISVVLLSSPHLLSAAEPTRVISSVGRGAPEFAWVNSRGGISSSRSLGRLPMVLIVADRADRKEVRDQAKRLEANFRDFAGLRVVFAVAITTPQPGRVSSNIPFIYAADGAQTAARFAASGAPFEMFIIGRDGNIELASDRVLSGQRVFDIIQNSRSMQLLQVR